MNEARERIETACNAATKAHWARLDTDPDFDEDAPDPRARLDAAFQRLSHRSVSGDSVGPSVSDLFEDDDIFEMYEPALLAAIRGEKAT
jgi:hypothetical protein